MLPSTYLEKKVTRFQRASDDAVARSLIVMWRLLPAVSLVFFPIIFTEAFSAVHLQGLTIVVISILWLLMIKKAGMEVWLCTEVLHAFKR
jgi:hypothetical protein